MKTLLLSLFALIATQSALSQQKETDFVKLSVSGSLTDPSEIRSLLDHMNTQDNQALFNRFAALIRDPAFAGQSTDMMRICNDLNSTFLQGTAAPYSISKKSAIIFIYRNMLIDANAILKKPITQKQDGDGAAPGGGVAPLLRGPGLNIDFTSMNSIVYARDFTGNWTNYLLGQKHITVVLIDAGANYYALNSEVKDNQLANSHVKIDYKTSFFKKSFKDLSTLFTQISGSQSQSKDAGLELRFTFFEIDPKRIKDPCDIVVQNKSFAKDAVFSVHETNYASFQVGLINTKYKLHNFSIAGGNLTVKPDSLQTQQWKSKLYAAAEFHLPRDIDNFRPLWKVIFERNPNRNARTLGHWLYDLTLARLGVYGGVKISTDPLSNLYSGFNYAITKDVSINFGWSWANEVTPQVTSIGNIGSVDDALKYARRKYTTGQFSWGLSFSPSSLISMLGLNEKKAD